MAKSRPMVGKKPDGFEKNHPSLSDSLIIIILYNSFS